MDRAYLKRLGGALCLALLLFSCQGAAQNAPVTHSPPLTAPRLHEPLSGSGVAIPSPVYTEGLRVQIPQLGIDLPVVEGRASDLGGAGEPPLGVAAHLPGMGWPGSGQRSFFYAHARPGMFEGLLTSGAAGERVEIVTPAGTLHYIIQSYTRDWPVSDLSIITPADHEEVVLYTCTSWTYRDPKVVAIAEPA